MSKTDCSSEQLTFWKLGKQQVTADFCGGRVVSDAGLLAVRRMERGLDLEGLSTTTRAVISRLSRD